jgi:hypothetical protein
MRSSRGTPSRYVTCFDTPSRQFGKFCAPRAQERNRESGVRSACARNARAVAIRRRRGISGEPYILRDEVLPQWEDRLPWARSCRQSARARLDLQTGVSGGLHAVRGRDWSTGLGTRGARILRRPSPAGVRTPPPLAAEPVPQRRRLRALPKTSSAFRITDQSPFWLV